jgi:hypothetical protein
VARGINSGAPVFPVARGSPAHLPFVSPSCLSWFLLPSATLSAASGTSAFRFLPDTRRGRLFISSRSTIPDPRSLPQSRHPGKKRARLPFTGAGHIPGDDLLSQDLSSHYHRRCGVSLPGSEWDRVVPPRSGHQRATPSNRCWDSDELSYVSVVTSNKRALSGNPCCRPLPDIHTEISNLQDLTSSWNHSRPLAFTNSKIGIKPNG